MKHYYIEVAGKTFSGYLPAGTNPADAQSALVMKEDHTMRSEQIKELGTPELQVVLDEAVKLLAIEEESMDAVRAHDTRCLLDQVTAELESRDDAET